eukprot:1153782-Pelagomonas_calceolata.AAC.7
MTIEQQNRGCHLRSRNWISMYEPIKHNITIEKQCPGTLPAQEPVVCTLCIKMGYRSRINAE